MPLLLRESSTLHYNTFLQQFNRLLSILFGLLANRFLFTLLILANLEVFQQLNSIEP